MSNAVDTETEIVSKLSPVAVFTAPPPPPVGQQSHPAPPPFPFRVSPYVMPATLPVDGDLCPPNLGRHEIGILEKLGDGQFGALHLAELDASSVCISTSQQLRKCVFLRLFRLSNDQSSVSDWLRDVGRLSVLRDPSIAKVVAMATDLSSGTCGDDVTMGLMTEYLEGGPLPVYLRQYRLGAADNFDPGVKTIR